MKERIFLVLGVLGIVLLLSGCPAKQAVIPVDPGSVPPASKVTRKGKSLALMGTAIAVGQKLPSTSLVDAYTMNYVDLSESKGSVLFLSIVPSIDTKVCEAQTHYLGEEGDRLPNVVRRITVSRDLPFAQKRFAEAAKLTDIEYLSDYREGAFGRSIGLLLDGPLLLSRAVILVDKQGIVQYIQVVPEITYMPDMEKAFTRAIELANE